MIICYNDRICEHAKLQNPLITQNTGAFVQCYNLNTYDWPLRSRNGHGTAWDAPIPIKPMSGEEQSIRQ